MQTQISIRQDFSELCKEYYKLRKQKEELRKQLRKAKKEEKEQIREKIRTLSSDLLVQQYRLTMHEQFSEITRLVPPYIFWRELLPRIAEGMKKVVITYEFEF